jgi:hypothetical protein
MRNYYGSKSSYVDFIYRRRMAKRDRKCESTLEDWYQQEPTLGSSDPTLFCMICDSQFTLEAGHPKFLSRLDDYKELFALDGDYIAEGRIPWWGWGIIVAVVPFALPICAVKLTVDAIRKKMKK